MPDNIRGMDSLIKKLNGMGGNVQGALNQAVRKVVLVARARAQSNYPVGKASQATSGGSGAGRTAIRSRTESTGAMVTGYVFTNSPHAVNRMPHSPAMAM